MHILALASYWSKVLNNGAQQTFQGKNNTSCGALLEISY